MKPTLILILTLFSTAVFAQGFKFMTPDSARIEKDKYTIVTLGSYKPSKPPLWRAYKPSWDSARIDDHLLSDFIRDIVKDEIRDPWPGQEWPPKNIGILPKGEMALEAGEGINIEIVGKNTIRISAAKDTINPQPTPIDMRSKPNYSLPPDRNVLLSEGDIFYILKNDRYEMYVINDGKPVKIKQE